MNYYPHHIGDYLRDTAHLTATEDGIYRRMLDVYYASEKPLPLDLDWLCRLLRAKTEEEKSAVQIVLAEFFEKREVGWRNKRAEEEIRKSRARIKAAKTNGKRGGRPRTQEKPSGLPVGSQKEALQKPKAKSQKKDKSIVGQVPDLASQTAVVLTYLNEQASRDYRPINGNLSLIAARLREGATVEDCKAVIDRKCREWRGGDMEKYLRPATLFNATKFAQYQGERDAQTPTGEVV